MPSLVIGNGESRKGIDFKSYSDYTLIGCNGLHRDIIIDHLICCDKRMVEESIISENTLNTKIYVRPDWFRYFRKIRKDKRIHQVPELPYAGSQKKDNPIHWGSGPYAVLVAAQLDTEITLIGFDLYPKNDKINNIYKGTRNYSPRSSKPVDYAYWVYQIGMVFHNFKDRKFTILNDRDWEMPREWKHPNVSFEVLATKNLTLA